jgi:hypothetical protein
MTVRANELAAAFFTCKANGADEHRATAPLRKSGPPTPYLPEQTLLCKNIVAPVIALFGFSGALSRRIGDTIQLLIRWSFGVF